LGRRLRRLERQGDVRIVRRRQRTRVYLPAEFQGEWLATLRDAPRPLRLPEPEEPEPAPVPEPHPLRSSLLDLIREDPGITKSDLCRSTGASAGTVAYHVRVLIRYGQIRAVRQGRRTCLFPVDVGRAEAGRFAVLRQRTARVVAAVLQRRPGSRLSDVAQATGHSRQLVHHHLRHLCDAGIVARADDLYSLSDDAHEILRHVFDHDDLAPELAAFLSADPPPDLGGGVT